METVTPQEAMRRVVLVRDLLQNLIANDLQFRDETLRDCDRREDAYRFGQVDGLLQRHEPLQMAIDVLDLFRRQPELKL